jgi:hypothetical protein
MAGALHDGGDEFPFGEFPFGDRRMQEAQIRSQVLDQNAPIQKSCAASRFWQTVADASSVGGNGSSSGKCTPPTAFQEECSETKPGLMDAAPGPCPVGLAVDDQPRLSDGLDRTVAGRDRDWCMRLRLHTDRRANRGIVALRGLLVPGRGWYANSIITKVGDRALAAAHQDVALYPNQQPAKRSDERPGTCVFVVLAHFQYQRELILRL